MKQFDPTTLEIYRALYTSVAEEMGISLRRSAFSPNIKERRDYSCAVFNAEGKVIAQGDHMPVHLGSMPMAVASALRETIIEPGDVVALNDPFAGGTHLPDVTLVMGVFNQVPGAGYRVPGKNFENKGKGEGGKANREGGKGNRKRGLSPFTLTPDPSFSTRHPTPGTRHPVSPFPLTPDPSFSTRHPAPGTRHPLFYVANRAHHADIGGATPGSMGLSSDLYGEGLCIPPVKLVRAGEVDRDVMRLILANVRSHNERRGDFQAQIGSLKTGATRLLEIIERRGTIEATSYATHLIEYSARLMRQAINAIPDGTYEAADALDDDGISDGEVVIKVRVEIAGTSAVVDFTGSAPQVSGPINAVEAITVSAVSYVFRCLLGDDVPASAGLMAPIKVMAPEGTVVNALHPASVAGGNVETSQRIVDVLFKALALALPEKIPAASQGTMNNLTIGGIDHATGREFSYYETVAGGMGARPSQDGMSAVHTHMTNSLNTPAEAMEYAYPLRVREYGIRKGSGGKGKRKGGDGVIREIETLVPAQMSLLSDRRQIRPYGLGGGNDGAAGKASIIDGKKAKPIDSKGSWDLKAGDRIRIETPGGGGFGNG